MCKRLHFFPRARTVLLSVLRRHERLSSPPRRGRKSDSRWSRSSWKLRGAALHSFALLVSSRWLTAQDASTFINIQVKADQGFLVVTSIPEWRSTPIILGESDPEGCAACSAQEHAEYAYRNAPLFASYTAAVLNQIDALAASEHVNFQGALTWNQPYFAGFRELATNGIDRPVLDAFRMLGLLSGRRLAVNSAGAVPADEVEISQ